jgi:IS30 family transposase
MMCSLHKVFPKRGVGWSPDLIAGRLGLEKGRRLIHRSSICRFIANDQEQLAGKVYYTKLPRFGQRRKGAPRNRTLKSKGKRRSICERTKYCELRRKIGHIERDLIKGLKGKKAVLVIADRKKFKHSESKIKVGATKHPSLHQISTRQNKTGQNKIYNE